MAIVTDQNNLFNLVTMIRWNGTYSGSQGTQDFSSVFSNEVYNPTIQSVQSTPFMSTDLVTTGFNQYYKMQGFNSATSKYEVWFSMGKPNYIPPSGNPLTGIEVVLAWVDR